MFGHKRLDAIFDAVCHSTYTPATRIANLFNVTERTVRSDIAKINSALENNGAYIDIKRGSGYFLVIQNQDLFDDFRSSASAREPVEPELSSSDARIRYLLCDLLCSSDYRSDDELSGTIYVGEKTLQSYIRHIKELLVSYDLALLVKAGTGCKVIGREEDRRRCFMDHVLMRNMRSYVKGFSDEEARLFPSVDLAKLEGIVCNHLELSDIAPTDYGLKNILVHCALMVSRVLAGCPIEGGGDAKTSSRVALFLDDVCRDLEDEFSISIGQPERAHLLRHILSNTNLDRSGIDNRLFQGDVEALLDIVMKNYGFDLRDDIELKRSLLQHLCSTFSSKDLKIVKKNPLLNTIRSTFPLAFEIALTSTNRVFDTEPYTLSEDEIGYVALHLGAAMERHMPANRHLHEVVLVCGSGNSAARMLESRLEALFGDRIAVAKSISYREFEGLDEDDLDDVAFVVTTVPIEKCLRPCILVDFSLSVQDTEAISRMLNSIEEHSGSHIDSFFDRRLFCRLSDPHGKGEVLETLCSMLHEQGYADPQLLPSVLEREALSDTTMDPLFAIPHPLNPASTKTKVAVAVLDHPIDWSAESEDVRIVFLLAIRAGDRSNIEYLYDLLLDIANDRHMQHDILKVADFDDFMAALERRSQSHT